MLVHTCFCDDTSLYFSAATLLLTYLPSFVFVEGSRSKTFVKRGQFGKATKQSLKDNEILDFDQINWSSFIEERVKTTRLTVEQIIRQKRSQSTYKAFTIETDTFASYLQKRQLETTSFELKASRGKIEEETGANNDYVADKSTKDNCKYLLK